MSDHLDPKQIKTVTGLRKRYAKAAIKVLKWLEDGAHKDEFPGIDQNVKLNMYTYIDLDSRSVCLAGAMRIAYKRKFPAASKAYELERHFDFESHSKLDTLFYGFGVRPKTELVAEVFRRFLTTGVVDWRESTCKQEYQLGQDES